MGKCSPSACFPSLLHSITPAPERGSAGGFAGPAWFRAGRLRTKRCIWTCKYTVWFGANPESRWTAAARGRCRGSRGSRRCGAGGCRGRMLLWCCPPARAQKMAYSGLGQNNSPFSQDPQKDLGSLQLIDFLGSSSTEGGAKSLSGFGDLAHGCEVAVGRR